MIADMGDRWCRNVPLYSESSTGLLSGQAKAELENVFARLLALGVDGAGRYGSDSTKGVLQKDLASALKEELQCRDKIWKDIFGVIFPTDQKTEEDYIIDYLQFGFLIEEMNRDRCLNQKREFASSNGLATNILDDQYLTRVQTSESNVLTFAELLGLRPHSSLLQRISLDAFEDEEFRQQVREVFPYYARQIKTRKYQTAMSIGSLISAISIYYEPASSTYASNAAFRRRFDRAIKKRQIPPRADKAVILHICADQSYKAAADLLSQSLVAMGIADITNAIPDYSDSQVVSNTFRSSPTYVASSLMSSVEGAIRGRY